MFPSWRSARTRWRIRDAAAILWISVFVGYVAAPSHVSALMSGIMTKVAIYGMVRLLFDLAGPPAWWWGAVVLVLRLLDIALDRL